MLVLAAFGFMLAGFALYLRSAIVALNKDVRLLLDRQAGLRDRMDAIDSEQSALRAYMEALRTTGDDR
jgi:hypothetical protein